MLTQERLKELLTYNPDSGMFTWNRNKKPAGYLRSNKYVVITIDYKTYYAHRLAHLFMTGNFPIGQVDHIDRDRSNNCWSNLRECTSQENKMNRTKTRLLPTGVYQIERKGRPGVWFCSIIQLGGKRYSSTFRSLEDAVAWRINKEKELFGEFRPKV